MLNYPVYKQRTGDYYSTYLLASKPFCLKHVIIICNMCSLSTGFNVSFVFFFFLFFLFSHSKHCIYSPWFMFGYVNELGVRLFYRNVVLPPSAGVLPSTCLFWRKRLHGNHNNSGGQRMSEWLLYCRTMTPGCTGSVPQEKASRRNIEFQTTDFYLKLFKVYLYIHCQRQMNRLLCKIFNFLYLLDLSILLQVHYMQCSGGITTRD